MKSVVYATCTKLPCIDTLQAPVVLCLKDTIELVFGKHTLPGFLLVSNEVHEDCSCETYWRYTISYDEELLVEPVTVLLPDDIVGVFCETCFTDWLKELTENSSFMLTVLDTASIDLTLAGTVLSGDVKISADAGNIVEIQPDGLFVPPVCVTDSDSIDFSIDGGGCVTGDVIISESGGEGGNGLVLLEDGLFVEPNAAPDVWNTQSIGGGAVTLSVFSPLVLAACNAVASPTVLTIPTVGAGSFDFAVTVIKTDVSANTVTIGHEFGLLINGAATYVLTAQYQSVTLKRFGSLVYILAKTP